MIRTLWKIYKILRWHKKTFPNFTWAEQLEKVCEESIEFPEATFFKSGEEALKEGADVIISSIGALRYEEIWDLVEEKMEENKQRTWKNGHHIDRKSNFKR